MRLTSQNTLREGHILRTSHFIGMLSLHLENNTFPVTMLRKAFAYPYLTDYFSVPKSHHRIVSKTEHILLISLMDIFTQARPMLCLITV